MAAPRPAFQFYPDDWRKDPGLRTCSLAARGAWFEILCIAHECEPYGVVLLNGAPMNADQLAGVVGGKCTTKAMQGYLDELERVGVFSRRPEDGAIYSRRMVKDERLRQVRAAGGKLGGNPALKVSNKVNHEVVDKVNHTPNLSANLPPTPSFAFAVASSLKSKALFDSPEKPSAEPNAGPLHRQIAKDLLARLNRLTNHHFKDVPANIDPIVSRLKEGYTEREIRVVIANKCAEWKHDEKMAQYARPKTLFNRTNFANYAGEVPAAGVVDDGA